MTKRKAPPAKKQDRTLLISGIIAAVAVVAVVSLILFNQNAPAAASACASLNQMVRDGGMTTTASGLQYKVITEGTGPIPSASSRVTVNYRGCLLNNTEFDSSYDASPITFSVGGVIAGWTEGLQLMPTGSHYLFYIPSELGYGAGGNGSIPPNAPLVFEVELLGFQ